MFRILLILLLGVSFAACDRSPPKLNTGDIAPAFTTIHMDGKPMRFPDDVRGKTVILRFWADWCTACETELMDLERIYKSRNPQGLVVLAVNAGQDAERVGSYMAKFGFSYPSLLDQKLSIAKLYGVDGVPTTFYIGADGRLKLKVVGSLDHAYFDNLAEEVMSGTR